ncbi:MAG TPA: NTP transferase domain-containing protein [Candidatus Acidoferrum sp.]|nr:NTP transferase domain-containing protein [Candidatus Acidoferrum sp.]
MLTVVILAAGLSTRFGSQKLLHKLEENDTLFERAIRAAGTFDSVIVCSEPMLPLARARHTRAVLNWEPKRGMAYSLRLANGAVEHDRPILVLPADLLLVEPHHLAEVAGLVDEADVVHPVRSDGTPGHPVYFSPRARARIPQLKDNEPIAALRDHPALTRRTIAIEDDWPYRDVDEQSDLP